MNELLQRPGLLKRVFTGMMEPFIHTAVADQIHRGENTPLEEVLQEHNPQAGNDDSTELPECSLCCATTVEESLVKCQSNHLCCVSCLKRHVETSFRDDPTQIQCPGFHPDLGEPCLELIPRAVLAEYLSEPELLKYDHATSKRFVQDSAEYQLCPFDDCDCVVYLGSESKRSNPHSPRGLTVTCENGHRWCWNCAWKRMAAGQTQLQHAPASCHAIAQMDALTELPEDDTGQATITELAATCKRCPFCHRMVHRFAGCPHMTCRPPGGCGNQFCWECLAP
eukprot:TRINITY_DN33747_c0_g1_i1.p1 TRINITY_DN33747_c0_g1~~TRINITY_DN33747_c0_g1_i1.p1  ORF type:complete len:281 (+),score=45.56 TRINITY_DN33747_c0_g1_i1:97-939(+)